MELLIKCGVLSVDKDLVVLEHDSLWWILVKYYIKFDHVQFLACEEHMLLHLFPAWSLEWIMLHRCVQEFKALQ